MRIVLVETIHRQLIRQTGISSALLRLPSRIAICLIVFWLKTAMADSLSAALAGDALTADQTREVTEKAAEEALTSAPRIGLSVPILQRYADSYLQSYITNQKALATQDQKYIYVGDDQHFDPKKTAFYKDPVWLTNFFKLTKSTTPPGSFVGQVDTNHPDCVDIGTSSRFGDEYAGSGTLIAPRLVVTAGHCILDQLTNQVLIGTNVSDPNRIVIPVVSAIPYTNIYAITNVYGVVVYSNDLGLLVLRDPVKNVTPRKIATTAIMEHAIGGFIAGFGFTNADQNSGLGTRRYVGSIAFGNPNDSGYEAFPGIEYVAAALFINLSSLGMDTCEGDSGGPLYVISDGVEYLAGTTSRGVAGTTFCGEGGIYLRLDSYRDWIVEMARRNGMSLN